MNRLITLVGVAVLFFAGCKKDNPGPDNPDPVFTSPSFKFYDFGTIRYSHGESINSIIDCRVNDKEAKLAIVNDSTIGFAIYPSTYVEGSNNMTFSINGQSFDLSFVVEAATPPADPEKVFNDFHLYQSEQLSLLESIRAADTTGYLSDPKTLAAFSSIQTGILQIKNEWAALNSEDKRMLANFLAPRIEKIQELNSSLQDLITVLYQTDHGLKTAEVICANGTAVERYKCIANRLGKELWTVIEYTTLSAACALTIPVSSGIGIAASGIFGGLAIVSVGKAFVVGKYFATINFKIVSLLVFGEETPAQQKTTAIPIFLNNSSTNLNVYAKLRNISSSDQNAPLDWLSGFVNAIGMFNDLCDQFTILSKLKLEYAPTSYKSTRPFSLSHLTVHNISDPEIICLGIGGTVAQPTITFSTTKTGADIAFTYDLRYNDGVNLVVNSRQEGKLRTQNRVPLLMRLPWKQTGEIFDNGTTQTDVWTSIAPCRKDNITYFNSSTEFGYDEFGAYIGNFVFDEGLTKCTPGSEQTWEDYWWLVPSQEMLRIENIDYEVVQLDSFILKIRFGSSSGGIVTLTYEH